MCSIVSAGADGINVSSKERNGNVVAVEGSPVHPHCRKRYTDKKDIALFKRKSDEKLDTVTNRKSQRILSPTRDSINLNCVFCDRTVDFDNSKKHVKDDASKVQTDQFVQSILKCCRDH